MLCPTMFLPLKSFQDLSYEGPTWKAAAGARPPDSNNPWAGRETRPTAGQFQAATVALLLLEGSLLVEKPGASSGFCLILCSSCVTV